MGKIGKLRSLSRDLRKNYDSATTKGSSCCTIYVNCFVYNRYTSLGLIRQYFSWSHRTVFHPSTISRPSWQPPSSKGSSMTCPVPSRTWMNTTTSWTMLGQWVRWTISRLIRFLDQNIENHKNTQILIHLFVEWYMSSVFFEWYHHICYIRRNVNCG